MKTTTQSLQIASESHTSRVIPIFHTHPANDFSAPPLSPTWGTRNPFCIQKRQNQGCRCPDVIIADDDSFQHMYYHMLFQRSLTQEGSVSLNIEMCFSGEELLQKLNNIIDCGCDKLKLMITDYHMGNNKLNGVETSVKVRELGYKGAILLRTSEIFKDLHEKHGNLERLCKEKTINKLVEKCDLIQSKAIIQSYIKG